MFELTHLNHIREILEKASTIAVVGLSPKKERPSNMVGKYLIEAGYTVIPVNPGQDSIFGLQCYPDLASVPQKIDIVDIFRRSEDVLPVVEQAIAIGAATIWMQQGIIHHEAAEVARKNNMKVIMDRCIKVDHENFFS